MLDQLIIPADIYDYHELVSEAYNGVGAGIYFNGSELNATPCCILGQQLFAYEATWLSDIVSSHERKEFRSYSRQDWYRRLYNIKENDRTVWGENGPMNYYHKIPWAEYCKRRNIVRGE